jgi:hypothetical protein
MRAAICRLPLFVGDRAGRALAFTNPPDFTHSYYDCRTAPGQRSDGLARLKKPRPSLNIDDVGRHGRPLAPSLYY